MDKEGLCKEIVMTPYHEYHENFRVIVNELQQQEILAMRRREAAIENINVIRRQADMLVQQQEALAMRIREAAVENVNTIRRQVEVLARADKAAVENMHALQRQAGVLMSISTAVSDEMSRLQNFPPPSLQKTSDPPYLGIMKLPQHVARFEGSPLFDQIVETVVEKVIERLEEDQGAEEPNTNPDNRETYRGGNYL